MNYIPEQTYKLTLEWVLKELYTIGDELSRSELKRIWHEEPGVLQEGLEVIADGTDWDPLTLSGSTPYKVLYTSSGWIAI